MAKSFEQFARQQQVDAVIFSLNRLMNPTPDQSHQALQHLDGNSSANDFARHLLIKLAKKSVNARNLLKSLSDDALGGDTARRATDILDAATS